MTDTSLNHSTLFRIFFSIELLNTIYKPTVTNETVYEKNKTKQKKYTIKLVNTRPITVKR